MPDLIIFMLGVVVTLFTVVAVILIGASEAQDLREAGILDPGTDGRAPGGAAADRLRSPQGDKR
ncbi:MAG: hypothetical protein ACYTE6_00480 [Planctomycetota bacterium]|jgi:hypothetical protein